MVLIKPPVPNITHTPLLKNIRESLIKKGASTRKQKLRSSAGLCPLLL